MHLLLLQQPKLQTRWRVYRRVARRAAGPGAGTGTGQAGEDGEPGWEGETLVRVRGWWAGWAEVVCRTTTQMITKTGQ